MASRREKVINFTKRLNDKVELKHVKILAITVVLLLVSLFTLSVNRSESYVKCDRIQFISSGSTLHSNLYFPANTLEFQDIHPLIIYAHGIGGQRDFDIRVPIEFTKRGFYVAAIDYQGHGDSGGDINNIDLDTKVPALAQDCSKLLDKIESLPSYSKIDPSQIGLIGHSLGGMVVLMNQALDPRFKATVVWAPLVDPENSGVILAPKVNAYAPVNILNEHNSKNLLIISHADDEDLSHEKNAVIAQKLTNGVLFTLTEPLFGGNHQLYSNDVMIESINWFERIFFKSETINGPITITFVINYLLIALSLLLLIVILFSLINISTKYFILLENKKKDTLRDKIDDSIQFSTSERNKQIYKIIAFFSVFISFWTISFVISGLMALMYASLVMVIVYIVIRTSQNVIKSKKGTRLSSMKKILKEKFQVRHIEFCLIAIAYFIGLYMLFSYFYPFMFVFPSRIIDSLLALLIYPIYLSMEILYRKVIYPQLKFVKTEKSKTRIMISISIVTHVFLFMYAWSLAFMPIILVTFLLFLFVIIFNTMIYAHTKEFTSVVLSSLIIIVLFFGATVSSILGIFSTLSRFNIIF